MRLRLSASGDLSDFADSRTKNFPIPNTGLGSLPPPGTRLKHIFESSLQQNAIISYRHRVRCDLSKVAATHLSVDPIAGLLQQDVPKVEFRKDSPNLTLGMIEAARIRVQAHPRWRRSPKPSWRNARPLSAETQCASSPRFPVEKNLSVPLPDSRLLLIRLWLPQNIAYPRYPNCAPREVRRSAQRQRLLVRSLLFCPRLSLRDCPSSSEIALHARGDGVDEASCRASTSSHALQGDRPSASSHPRWGALCSFHSTSRAIDHRV